VGADESVARARLVSFDTAGAEQDADSFAAQFFGAAAEWGPGGQGRVDEGEDDSAWRRPSTLGVVRRLERPRFGQPMAHQVIQALVQLGAICPDPGMPRQGAASS
jgi:hypothetical protein